MIDWTKAPIQFDQHRTQIMEIEDVERDLDLDRAFQSRDALDCLEGAANNNGAAARQWFWHTPQTEMLTPAGRAIVASWRYWPVRTVELLARNPRPAITQRQ